MPKPVAENKGHQVFISYANEKGDNAGSDRQIAHLICSVLESENIRCWIDHRDIMTGENWVNAMFGPFYLFLGRHAEKVPAVGE